MIIRFFFFFSIKSFRTDIAVNLRSIFYLIKGINLLTTRHRETCWQNDDVSIRVSESENTIKEKYVEIKKKATRAICQAKFKAEKRRPGDVLQGDGSKGYMFKIAKRIWSKLIRIFLVNKI